MSFLDFLDPIASIASGAIGGIGSFFGQRSANIANRDIARDTNAANAALNAQNNQFNERMANNAMAFADKESSTAWQRGVADMKAAGINPMLAFSRGGASSPSGVSASASTVPAVTGARMENTFGGVPNALQLARLSADVRKATADAAKSEAGVPKAQVHGKVWQTANDVVTSALNSAKALVHSSSLPSFSAVHARTMDRMAAVRSRFYH